MFALLRDTAPMEAKAVAALPDPPGWQFELKWDGLRCLAFKAGTTVDLRAKSGDRAAAAAWLAQAHGALDGLVAKRVDHPYAPGERAMLKVKRRRSADCMVGGFRYAQESLPGGARLVGSLLLGLYNDAGTLDHVGFTAGFAHADRPALTVRVEALQGGPGFTGDAPGGPSRWRSERSTQWTPLRPERVVEVSYDHATGGRFRHGTTLLRWRPDKAARQCTTAQLAQEARPGRLFGDIL